MKPLDENRDKAVQFLTSDGYQIDEYEGTILASKYCEREPGSVMCLLIEVNPPYNQIKPWGGISYSSDDNLGKLINLLNENLKSMRTSSSLKTQL
jgi:hypothetical protein